MVEIVSKEQLNDITFKLELLQPEIAKKAKAGQFIIYRVNEYAERIPLTVHDVDTEKGTFFIVFQSVGKSTKLLSTLNVGDTILDVVGPLGEPTHIEGYKNVAVVVGGLGCAIGYFTAKQLHELGANVDIVAGFRTKDIVILENEMKKASTNLYICSDDGSVGFNGFVTNKLAELIEEKEYDLVITIGPLPMMRAVAEVTKDKGIKTMASMNPIMVDGSGMCGCCRLTVADKVKFACVDGPDFDAHEVNFDELIIRNRFYQKTERSELDHYCNLLKETNNE